jgi:hypothetical protein
VRNPNSPVDFESPNERLAMWVRHRLDAGVSSRVAIPGIADDAMGFHGSIGYESALTSVGQMWLGEYDLDGPKAFEPSWRLLPSGSKEWIGMLVIGARQFSELQALIPSKPPAAPACASCVGTGEHRLWAADRVSFKTLPGVICADCAGLGWQLSAG